MKHKSKLSLVEANANPALPPPPSRTNLLSRARTLLVTADDIQFLTGRLGYALGANAIADAPDAPASKHLNILLDILQEKLNKISVDLNVIAGEVGE
jgi:hypothetical protein